MPHWDGALDAFGAAVDGLLEAVRTGRPHPCDVRFGARLTEILAEAEAAAAASAQSETAAVR